MRPQDLSKLADYLRQDFLTWRHAWEPLLFWGALFAFFVLRAWWQGELQGPGRLTWQDVKGGLRALVDGFKALLGVILVAALLGSCVYRCATLPRGIPVRIVEDAAQIPVRIVP